MGRPEPGDQPQQAQPQSAPNVGGLDVAAVRRAWPDVLETIKRSSRVAWVVLQGGVQVVGLEGNLMTLAFDNEGNRNGFTRGGRDAAVREAIKELFGAEVRIDTVPAGQAVPPSRPAPPSQQPSQQLSQQPSQQLSQQPRPAPAQASAPPPPPHQPHGAQPPQAAQPSAPQATPPSAPQPPAAPPRQPSRQAPQPSRAAQVPDLPPPPDEPPPFDESEEVGPDGDRDAGAEEAISGMALIQRELGGQVIKEIDNT